MRFSRQRGVHDVPRARTALLVPLGILHLALCTSPLTPGAAAADPLALVPAESLLCWAGQPFPDAKPADDQPSAIATLIDLGTRLAGKELDPRGQLWVRILEGAGHVVRYPYAVALIDARARPLESDPVARQVDQLKLALVVNTGGNSEPFLRVIQKIVNEQTAGNHAVLERSQARHWSYQSLRDKRLPAWSAISWGQIDDCFVVTLGQDVWPAVAATAADRQGGLLGEDWVRQVRAARGPALIEIIVRVREMRDRLDPFVLGRATDFFAAWQAESLERAFWRLGFEGRAMFCEAHLLEGGQARRRVFADASASDAAVLTLMPPDARYAVYKLPIARLIPRLAESLTSTRGREFTAAARRAWARIEHEHGFELERDLLDHLGDTIILHNSPPHPLRVPLMFTTLAEIKGDPRRVRETLDKVCAAWQTWLRSETADETGPSPAAVERDGDGVWYLRFGPLATFAWTVTDRHIAVSWSPTALRQYLHEFGNASGP